MTKQSNYIIILFALFIVANAFGQPARTIGGREVVLDDNASNKAYITTLLGGVGINQVNASPHPCALLDLSSTTKGFLVPRLTPAEVAALCGGAPPEAMIVYNTGTHNLNIWNGTMYMAPWQTAGNQGTNAITDYLGTRDAMDFVIRTNSVERMRFIGAPAPNSSAAPLLTIANPGANQQGVRLNGTTNGVIGNTLAGNPGVWDMVINGDAVVSGLFKLGASIWVDGFTPNNHAILADDDLTIGTNAPGQNLTLTTGPGGVINVNAPLILPAFPLDVTVNNATFAVRGTQNGTGVALLGVHSAATGTSAAVRGETNSQDGNAIAVQGVVNSSSPGGFSAGVRGINNGTGGLGIGVYGSQAGSGWGVYGTTLNGIGVHGNSANGFGMYGLSTNGTAVYGLSTNGTPAHFDITNNANSSNVLEVITNSTGKGIVVQLTNAASSGRGIEVTHAGVGTGVFSTSAGSHGVWGITGTISGAGILGDNTYGEAVVGRNRGGIGVGAVVGRNDSSGYGVRGFNTKNGIGVLGQAGTGGGTGVGGRFENVNAANTSTTLEVQTNGVGSGISVQLTNAASSARGIDVAHAGFGPGVYSNSVGGMGLWGITSSISAAGVLGDNTLGEAVVGRNRGGIGVGAVVGRNDSSGYGVRGFNTLDGIGVLGQAGIGGGTGVGGRFENVNAGNSNDALQAASNGTGWAGNFTNTNGSSASRGIRISTTAGQGGNALTLANGTLSLSRQHPYASNTVIDDAILVVTTAGNVTVPTGPPLVDGATVWVVNNAGAVITITNTTVGAFNVNPGRAIQLLFVSTVSGANWIPVQP